MTKTQTRGICQCCGREQAVVRGRMAKHGYTVDDGYFNGVCSGNRYEPLQIKRDITDKMIGDVRADCSRLDAYAIALQQGQVFPKDAFSGRYEKGRQVRVPYAEASMWYQKDAVTSAIYTTEQRARMGRAWADDMEKLANTVHGSPLREVALADGPAPILEGEKRQSARGVLTARYAEKGKVQWTDEKGFRSWMGVQAWRALKVVE